MSNKIEHIKDESILRLLEKQCLPKVISKLDAYLMNSFSTNITFQFVIFWLPYFEFGNPK